MTCSHARPFILVLGLSLACTRDNPAFGDEAGDDDSDASGESDSTTRVDDETGDATDEASTDVSDTQTDDASSDATSENPVDDLPGDLCEGELRGGLALGFADPFFMNGSCPDILEMHGMLTLDPNTQSLVLNRCHADDVLCEAECGYEVHPIDVDFDIGTFGGSCVSVQAAKPFDLGVEDTCSWGTISMFPSGNDSTPLAVAVTAGTQPVDIANNALAGHPSLTQTAMCECSAFDIADSCCVDSDTQVLFFDLELPGRVVVSPGETTELELGPYMYKFQAEQAQRVGNCGTNSGIDISWAMWAQF